jgi:GNAT superfamily N-acetyltransferase
MLVGVVEADETRELRRTVLRPHRAPGEPLPGDDLAVGTHIGARDDDGVVVGTCFVFPDPCPWRADAVDAWRLRQMATAPDRRGEGIGSAVLDAAIEWLRGQGASLVWCHAREGAVEFYARRGFRAHGAIFIDREHPIPHLRMWRDVPEPVVGATSSEL